LLLDYSQVTDAGLASVKGFSRLTALGLRGSQVTDAGLKHLIGFASLKDLDVRDTQITHAGALVLQKALPRLKILR
jgi:hypothetical protein